MLKKTIKYTDYNGNEREEDFYFNITKAELAMIEASRLGGFQAYLEKITKTQDNVALMETFREIIRAAYGEKSDDGRRFIKSEELSSGFEQTEAYSNLIMEFLSEPNAVTDFFKGILPRDLFDEAQAQVNKQNLSVVKGNE